MNDTESNSDADKSEKKPRKTHQLKPDRIVTFLRIQDNKAVKFGSFPDVAIGEPLERRLLPFMEERNFGPGAWKAEIRTSKGHFERSYDFEISDSEPSDDDRIIDVDPEDLEDYYPSQFSHAETPGQMTAVEVENMLLKERLKRVEEDTSRQRLGNQTETQTLILALEESRREQRELMMLMISQAQKPQQDATAQAMGILEKSLGIVTKAKAISEEFAPTESQSNGGFMSDAARLIDSVGKNAGTFAPLIMGALGGANRPPVPPPPSPVASEPSPAAGELGNLAEKIQAKQAAIKTEAGAPTKK